MCCADGSYLGAWTPTCTAFLTTSPRMTSTSKGRLASRSSNIDGLKQLGFVRLMASTASFSKVVVEIPLARATRTISPMISLIVAFTNSRCGSAKSSSRVAREIVHRLEYAAFLSSESVSDRTSAKGWKPTRGLSSSAGL